MSNYITIIVEYLLKLAPLPLLKDNVFFFFAFSFCVAFFFSFLFLFFSFLFFSFLFFLNENTGFHENLDVVKYLLKLDPTLLCGS